MPHIALTPLPGPFGVEARGVDLAGTLDDVAMRALAEACIEHKVLPLRGQRLSPEAYAAFAGRWGAPRINGFTERNVPGFDCMAAIGNVGGVNEQEASRRSASGGEPRRPRPARPRVPPIRRPDSLRVILRR